MKYKCKRCKVIFDSAAPKKYCTLKCYANSDEAKARLVAMNKSRTTRVESTCAHCNKGITVRAAFAGTRRFCNKICFRLFMAERFDRWIANPESIALPQAYDEFLTKKKLPCLIQGCKWKGHRLSHHVNYAHGIKVEDFKKKAGFSLNTPLWSLTESAKAANAPHISSLVLLGKQYQSQVKKRKKKGKKRYRSREANEHLHKTLILKAVDKVSKKCKTCKEMFESWTSDYCSRKCRDAKHLRKSAKCAECKKTFKPTVYQSYRKLTVGGLAFCSSSCAGRNAGKKPKRCAEAIRVEAR